MQEIRRLDDNIPSEAIHHQADAMGLKPPTAVYTPEPEFSEEALKSNIQGIAVFGIVVDNTGKIARIRLERALGYGLDENAFEALKKWRFHPATLNGEPVALTMSVEVSFNRNPLPMINPPFTRR